MSTNKIGVNTFGLNDCLRDDFFGTADKLKKAGFSVAEPMLFLVEKAGVPSSVLQAKLDESGKGGSLWMPSEAVKKISLLRQAGIEVHGMHLVFADKSIENIKGWADRIFSFAQESSLQYAVFNPHVKTYEQTCIVKDFLNYFLPLMKGAGVQVLIHNHAYELKNKEGFLPFAFLLREVKDLRFQIDVGWAQFEGEDPVGVMKQHSDKIASVHLKDIKKKAEGEDAVEFTAVGEGCIPLKDILSVAKECDLLEGGLVIDQDESKGDILSDLQTGLTNIKKWL